MKPIKIIIAVAAIALFSTLFSGCSRVDQGGDLHPSALQITEELQQVKKDVALRLEVKRDGDWLVVSIMLDNPSRKPITSVESWLSFDPNKLQGDDILISKSPFVLQAPYRNDFDNKKGLVMLGRGSNIPVTISEIHVADVLFKIIKNDFTTLDAYDYKPDLSGHVSANAVLNGWPFNVLLKPDTPSLVIQPNS